MYRSSLSKRDRAGTLAVVALIHLGLGYAFLNLSGTMRVIEQQVIPQLIDVDLVEPEPPIVEVQPEQDAAPEEEGEASPENIRSTATPVTAPRPRIELPVPPPMPVTETPNIGPDPTQGAADRPGPGTGAGGVGTGTGAGGSGSGTGGGGGAAVRAAVVRGITNRDYPEQIQRRWPRNGQIFVRLRVEPNGRPSQCDVMRGYGDRMADQWTCSLLMQRGVFRPATDARGQPVADWLGYVQRDLGRFER